MGPYIGRVLVAIVITTALLLPARGSLRLEELNSFHRRQQRDFPLASLSSWTGFGRGVVWGRSIDEGWWVWSSVLWCLW